MRVTSRLLASTLFVLATAAPGLCQASGVAAPASDNVAVPTRVFLVLAGGAKVEAEEVSERPEGFWYRRGNVWAVLDRSRVTRVERVEPVKKAAPTASAVPDPAPARWSLSEAARVESFFVKRFGRPLPVTAYGQSGLHTRWGYDHRRSMDVGLHPDSAEGRALMAFLSSEGIPFLGFRSAVPGIASAPHIHVGHPSRRLTSR